jgi:hypothetical protein
LFLYACYFGGHQIHLCGMLQGLRIIPQALRGAPQSLCGVPQALRGILQGLCGIPQALRGILQGLCSIPQALRGVLQGLRGVPQSSRSIRQNGLQIRSFLNIRICNPNYKSLSPMYLLSDDFFLTR